MIKVAEGVRFKIIPVEMTVMFDALHYAGEKLGIVPVITGAAYGDYPKGKVHDVGYAIDVRVKDVHAPFRYANTIRDYLKDVDKHFLVLYGDEGHLDHIHIGFSWHYAREKSVV